MDVLSCSHAKRLNDAQLCTCFTCISFHAVVIGVLSFLLAFCIFVIGFVLFVSFLHLYTRLSFKLACVLPISVRPDCLSTYLH